MEVKCEMAGECWHGCTGNCDHGKFHSHTPSCNGNKCSVFQVFNGLLKMICKPVLRIPDVEDSDTIS